MPFFRLKLSDVNDIRQQWVPYWEIFEKEFPDIAAQTLQQLNAPAVVKQYQLFIDQKDSLIEKRVKVAMLICRLTCGVNFIPTLMKQFDLSDIVAAAVRCSDRTTGYVSYSNDYPESYIAGMIIHLYKDQSEYHLPMAHASFLNLLDELDLEEWSGLRIRYMIAHALKIRSTRHLIQ